MLLSLKGNKDLVLNVIKQTKMADALSEGILKSRFTSQQSLRGSLWKCLDVAAVWHQILSIK